MSLSNISKIYVRTLKSIPERTDWIKKEMSRVGLDDYTLFYNVEKTSSELDEWREQGKSKDSNKRNGCKLHIFIQSLGRNCK